MGDSHKRGAIACACDRVAGHTRLDICAAGILVGISGHDCIVAYDVAQTLLRGEHERVGVVVAGDYILAKLRIEHPYLLDRYVEHLGNLVEVNTVGHLHGVGHELLLHHGGLQSEAVVIVHHKVGSDESWQIAASLCGEEIVDLPEIFFAATGASERFVDIARAAVVGGDGERPVVVDVVELAEVFGCCGRRLAWVAALVYERVYLKAESACRGGHELPETNRSRAAHGIGLDGALDHRQILQFERHVLFGELLDKYVAVVVVEGYHIGHKSAATGEIHVDKPSHDLIVGHLHLGRESREQLGILLGGAGGRGCGVDHLHPLGEIFEVEIFLKLAGCSLEAFGSYDIGVGDRMFDVENRHGGRSGDGCYGEAYCGEESKGHR